MKVKLWKAGKEFICDCGNDVFDKYTVRYKNRRSVMYRCDGCRRIYTLRGLRVYGKILKSGKFSHVSAMKYKNRSRQACEIAELYLTGLTYREIARRLGVSYNRIKYCVAIAEKDSKLWKAVIEGKRKSPFESRNADIARRYIAGEPITVIRTLYNLSPHTVKDIVKKLKAHRAPKSPLERRCNLSRDTEIFNRYCAGASAPLLAREFGLDRCHVLKIVRELRGLGFQFKPKGEKP